MLTFPKFATKKHFFDHIVKDQDKYIDQKLNLIKGREPAKTVIPTIRPKIINQIDSVALLDSSVIDAQLAINTTNLFDAHSDVHIPEIWDDSLKGNQDEVLLQEHVMRFANLIAEYENVKVFVKMMTWSELGFPYLGNTQVLIYEVKIEKSLNPFMHGKYAMGLVRQHSVGMRYVNLSLCVNDSDYGANYDAWKKYFPMVANASTAELNGYFWAVTKANHIEGSAVVKGSNFATPVISIKAVSEKQAVKEIEQEINYKNLEDKFQLNN